MRLQLHNPDAPVGQLWLGWLRLVARVVRERALWIALLVGAAAIMVAYQRPVTIDVGSTADDFFTTGFHEPEKSGQASFRWSAAESALRLRGIGKPLAP